MAPSSGSALALAARLRALDDDALAALIRDRSVRQAGVRDYFDLAEALLDRGSIQQALGRLDRAELAFLAAAAELAAQGGAPTVAQVAHALGIEADEGARRADAASRLGLLGRESGHVLPWDAVVEQLEAWPAFGLPSPRELIEAPAPAALDPVSDAELRFVDRGALERAFTIVSAVGELVYALDEEPARRLSRGGLALPDARRLAPLAGVAPEQLELLLELAASAGLVASGSRGWHALDSASWQRSDRATRWMRLAAGWLQGIPDELRTLLSQRAHAQWGDGLIDHLAWRYPAGGDTMRERVDRTVATAELLGVLAGATPSSLGAALVGTGPEAAARLLAEGFPAEVERVYLQHDLTVVAPGPLASEREHRLRGLAELEALGTASSYRVTAESIERALSNGETAETILEFLREISLTGIPQPLDYLVRDVAARFGAVRVAALEGEAGASLIVTAHDELAEQLLVDRRLAAIALHRDDEARLVSRFAPDVVYWTLRDARYPVAAEHADGRVAMLRRQAAGSEADPVGDDTVAIVVARIRDAGGARADDGDENWIARQLELAVRNRVAVAVTVLMPGGDEAQFVLEPAAVAGGRLRARDRRSDLERTLPLASITAVEPVRD